MKALIASILSVALIASAPSGCQGKNPATEAAKAAASLVFKLYVYDETGLAVATDTDDGGYLADITIGAVGDGIVMVKDPETGAEQPAPYLYLGTLPHKSYQAFGPGVISVSFTAEFLLFEGWKMECLTVSLPGEVVLQKNQIVNKTALPIEMTVTCLWP